MNKTKITHVFFDLDNTLWDQRRNAKQTLNQLFTEHKITELYQLDFEIWHEKYTEINDALWAQIRDGEISKEYLRNHRFKNTFQFFAIENDALAQIFDQEFLGRMTQMTKVVPGAKDLLEYLSPKYKLHIITNGFIEVSEDKINHSVLSGFFETLTTADEIEVRKPDARIFQLAIDKAQAQKENAILIGDDWIADVVGATRFGMQAVFFNPLNEQPETQLHVPMVTHLEQIKSLL